MTILYEIKRIDCVDKKEVSTLTKTCKYCHREFENRASEFCSADCAEDDMLNPQF